MLQLSYFVEVSILKMELPSSPLIDIKSFSSTCFSLLTFLLLYIRRRPLSPRLYTSHDGRLVIASQSSSRPKVWLDKITHWIELI